MVAQWQVYLILAAVLFGVITNVIPWIIFAIDQKIFKKRLPITASAIQKERPEISYILHNQNSPTTSEALV